jgi:hypothetical protein
MGELVIKKAASDAKILELRPSQICSCKVKAQKMN